MRTEDDGAKAFAAGIEGGPRAHVHLWWAMLQISKTRLQYHAERKLSQQLGFDVVDIGGEG